MSEGEPWGGKIRERLTLQEMECHFCNFSMEFQSALAGEWGQTNEFIYSRGWLTEWKGHRAQEDLGEQTTMNNINQNLALPRFFWFFISWVLFYFIFNFHRILIGLPFLRQNNSLKSESSLLDLQTLSRHFVKSPDFKLFFEAELLLVTAETCSSF